MGTLLLGLEIPSTHEIYSNFKRDGFSRPISASVVLTAYSETEIASLSHLRVCLVHMLSSTSHDSINHSANFPSRVYRNLSPTPQQRASPTTKNCSILEELTLRVPSAPAECQVGYSPCQGKIYKLPFHMPLPSNIPATAATDLGGTSSFLIATVNTADGKTVSTSQEIRLTRRRIIPKGDCLQHTRTFPTSTVVADITLRQNGTSNKRCKISLDTEFSLRRPSVPANRSTEYKCVVIREIRWRVEEVVTLFEQPQSSPQSQDRTMLEPSSVETRSSTCELFNGCQKGYWGTIGNPIVKQHQASQEDSTISIPFDVSIPHTVTMAPSVSLSCYDFDSRPSDHLPPPLHQFFSSTTQRNRKLTIDHRLKLDILTSQDTFSAHTHELVDRTPLRTVLNASFPLDIVAETDCDIEYMACQSIPPLYTQVTGPPPNYDQLA